MISCYELEVMRTLKLMAPRKWN